MQRNWILVAETGDGTRYAVANSFDLKAYAGLSLLFFVGACSIGYGYWNWLNGNHFASKRVFGMVGFGVVAFICITIWLFGTIEVRITQSTIQRYTKLLGRELGKMETAFDDIEQIETTDDHTLRIHSATEEPWYIEGFSDKEDAEAFLQEIRSRIDRIRGAV